MARLPPDVAKRIDKVARDLKAALGFWYERDGELRVNIDVDAFRDTITIRVNAGRDDASPTTDTINAESENEN
jgi:hypothetical protein